MTGALPVVWTWPAFPSLEDMDFDPASGDPEGWSAFESSASGRVLAHYADRRDTPSIVGTARMSLHLQFGTVSVRRCTTGIPAQRKVADRTDLAEFYRHPAPLPAQCDRCLPGQADRVPWRHDEDHFQAWCEGRTGYPLVDAGMRELNATGFMHNRVRMVVASFLCKHLLLDWRWGERYFAEKLLDFELASNVGGWQWASGSGCDAAPYFRVFNPESQLKKFDPRAPM